MNSKHLLISIICCLTILTGCRLEPAAPREPANCFYLSDDVDLTSVGRITFVELNRYSSYQTVAQDITDSLFQAVQKRQLFGVDIIRHNDHRWKSLQLNPDRSYSLEELSVVHKTIHNNAMIVGAVTQYQPYPRMTIGLRLKMIDLQSGDLIWAFEQVWDSSDQYTKEKIKRYFRSKQQTGSEELNEQLIERSSKKFIDFIAYEVAGTLK